MNEYKNETKKVAVVSHLSSEWKDSVEKILSETGYHDVAKSYILYRKNHAKLRDIKSTIIDYKEIVNSYVNSIDWRVKENSTDLGTKRTFY